MTYSAGELLDSLVPSGYYDPAADAWKPSANGRVIKVLSTTGGVAIVDVRGTGSASSADTLAALGIDSIELERLATLYQAGATLWRVPISHFTTYDWNWWIFKPLFSPSPDGAPQDETQCDRPTISPAGRCGSAPLSGGGSATTLLGA